MQKKFSTALFFLILAFTNCKRGDPCENAGVINCVGIYYGSTKLNDSSMSWLPSVISQDVYFKSQTDTTKLVFNFASKNRMVFKDILYSYTEQRTCGIAYCDNYCNSEKETIVYQTENAFFDIELKREKDYYEYLNVISNEKVLNSRDRLMVNLNSKNDTSKFCFKIFIGQKDSSYSFRYYDSLALGNRTHKNVYERFYSRPNQNGLYVLGIYYTTDNGLVGFYLNNNQVWYVQ